MEGRQRHRGHARGDGETTKHGHDRPEPIVATHAIVPRCLL